MQILIQRRIYPFLLMVVSIIGILSFQIRQFKRLYEHIKNDKYLVGQRLVNYERKARGASSVPPPNPIPEYFAVWTALASVGHLRTLPGDEGNCTWEFGT
ncbi:unnamed protein product [Oncorhynchus mykiss]|uniref:RING-type E3 ubiquitin transferase n=1 Tax=Oncorhynchus mykiss TaxID=8022 RepID=A0A060XJW0_ONCMY|nr:unnamed protein product [Oncorhynchus mykiss]